MIELIDKKPGQRNPMHYVVNEDTFYVSPYQAALAEAFSVVSPGDPTMLFNELSIEMLGRVVRMASARLKHLPGYNWSSTSQQKLLKVANYWG